MTREQFHHLVNHPAGISEASAEQLPDLIRQFPYCQALRYLQLRYLSEKDSIHYPQQLKITSAYAPDRGRLFRIIHPEPELLVVPEEEPNAAAVVAAAEPAVIEVRAADEASVSAFTQDQPAEETTSPKAGETVLQSLDEKLEQLDQWEYASGNLTESASEKAAVKESLVSPGLYIAPAETPEQVPELPEPDAGSDDLDKLIREELIQQELNALNSFTPVIQQPKEIQEPVRENPKPIPTWNTPSSPTPTAPPVRNAEIPRPVAASAAQPEPSPKDSEPKKQATIAEHRGETHSFSDWLKMGKHENLPESRQPDVPTKPATATELPNSPESDSGAQPIGKPRLIFSKQSSPHAAEEHKHIAARTPRPSGVTDSQTKKSTVETERVNPPSTPAGNTSEERFDYELLPPRKPIPDPSDVDTEIPRSHVPAKELIERFIQNEPRIHPSRSAFYSPVNMAKKSAQEEPEDLISETLARIHAEQGHFQKAITCYELLALKFPEKKRYFASLIDELKFKLNP